jgi:2-methylisocitrate lyase-like PEP mutase family enzyme
MTTPTEKAQAFRALHVPGSPLVLFNAWDAGSAKTVADAGAQAIATGSWSVAAAHGYADSEALPLDLVLANVARIVRSVDVPVTLDFERGYGASLDQLSNAIGSAIDAGAIGFNIEDGVPGGLRDLAEQAERIRAARAAADAKGVPVFINARTDVFLIRPTESHTDQLVEDALARADAYAQAGADGLFVPGLIDEALIASVCARSPLPVNIMMRQGAPSRARLASLGVARISYGPGPYRIAMQALAEAAALAMQPVA